MNPFLTFLDQITTAVVQNHALFGIAAVIAVLSLCLTAGLLVDWLLAELRVPMVNPPSRAYVERWLNPQDGYDPNPWPQETYAEWLRRRDADDPCRAPKRDFNREIVEAQIAAAALLEPTQYPPGFGSLGADRDLAGLRKASDEISTSPDRNES